MKDEYVTVADFASDFSIEHDKFLKELDKKYSDSRKECSLEISRLDMELKSLQGVTNMPDISYQASKIGNNALIVSAVFKNLALTIAKNIHDHREWIICMHDICSNIFSIEVADEIVGKK